MSDVAIARSLIRDIGGSSSVNDMLYSANKLLSKLFPHNGDASLQWSERRLKRWWYRETEVVRHTQMMELYEAARKAKEERELIEKARREHAEFIARTASLKAMLERQDEDFHSPQIGGLGNNLERVDRARDKGE